MHQPPSHQPNGTTRSAGEPAQWKELRSAARELQLAELERDIGETTKRLDEGLFHVAFVGQFKRGKSLLMNALLGEAVMPVGVTPVTSALVIVRHGERRARVEMRSGESRKVAVSEIGQFVTEEQNPSNRLRVKRVEVRLPSPLLATGMCLVDTPGIGSVFEANTAETREFVPHIDVAIAVLGADPPISGEEIALLASIAGKTDHLLLALNKCDRLSAAEVEQAATFTERVVRERLSVPVGRIYKVSAKEVIETGQPTRDWAELRRALEELARGSSAALVEEAAHRARRRFGAQLAGEIDERVGALTRSAAETEQRVKELRVASSEAERSLSNLSYLLKAEEDRFDQRLEREREKFIARARPELEQALSAAVAARPEERGVRLRSFAFGEAQRLVEPRILAWNTELSPFAEQLYREITGGFVERLNVFVDNLRKSGATIDTDFDSFLDSGLHARRGFYFNSLMVLMSPSPLQWLSAKILPGDVGRRRIERAALEFLRHLLETNSCRAANDYKDRLVESRRLLEFRLRAQLRDVVARAERAQAEAQRRRDEGVTAVEREVHRLTELRSRCA